MTTTMTVEYDCGFKIVIPLALRDDQALLANASLGDTMTMIADATHDQQCEACRG